MGEAKRKRELYQILNNPERMLLDTPGGRIHVQWDEQAHATPQAQLSFFAQFLHCTGLFQDWVERCPLVYASPNAPPKQDILGTWLLAILSGHKRYAHITAMRGDVVSARLLGMHKIRSEDALRRALSRMDAEQSRNWLQPQLLTSVRAALVQPWILDVDATIKPLFGHQEGAEIGYNPHKPGRPSHVLHTYWVSTLRAVLDVVVSGGKEHSASHALPGLIAILDSLAPNELPHLVRGDCAFGNEPFIDQLEARGQHYLFRLRQTGNVKKMLTRLFTRTDWTRPTQASQGFSAIEDRLKLVGWSQERRVIILRRPIKSELAITQADKTLPSQLSLLEPDSNLKAWEYVVLVTNCDYTLEAIAQLYRDRADCENGFDELKNQWGWGGFMTQDITRCQTNARAIALIYNWWSWYCRAAKPDQHMEAITSRALLLAGVGKAVSHAGQTTLYLTTIHAAKTTLMKLIANIHAALQYIKDIAEQLPAANKWNAFIDYVVAKIVRIKPPIATALAHAGDG